MSSVCAFNIFPGSSINVFVRKRGEFMYQKFNINFKRVGP